MKKKLKKGKAKAGGRGKGKGQGEAGKAKRPRHPWIDYERRLWTLRGLGFESYERYLASPTWARIRARVFNRDRGCCRLCGKPATQVHHTAYTSDNLSGASLEYLAAICRMCHVDLERSESGKRPAKEVGAEYRRRRREFVRVRKGPPAVAAPGVMFFFRAKSENSAHIWLADKEDTACGMWGAGEMNRKAKWIAQSDPEGRKLCLLCLRADPLTEEFRAIVRG